LLEHGLDAGKVLAAEDFAGEVNQDLAEEYDSFKDEIVSAFYDSVPPTLQPDFQKVVVGKRAGDWVKALVDFAPKLPSVQQAVYDAALSTAKELVPAASLADFDRELEGTSKDLKGLLHAAYQSGFLTRAPSGSPVARASGGGTMDIERWRKDREFRRTLSREDNNAYHAESMRLQREAAGLT
jgi:hypothetical protein